MFNLFKKKEKSDGQKGEMFYAESSVSTHQCEVDSRPYAIKKYAYIPLTYEDWKAEDYLVRRGFPRACPFCKTVGFYAPCYANGERRYRACKFCGIWQEVGGSAYRCVAATHKCKSYKKARPVWNWFVPWSDTAKILKGAKNYYNATSALACQCGNMWKLCKWAIDDPKHYFRSFKGVDGGKLKKK